jgi:hypothetical protein
MQLYSQNNFGIQAKQSLSENFEQMSTNELEQLMENSSILNRVHAIAALSHRSGASHFGKKIEEYSFCEKG